MKAGFSAATARSGAKSGANSAVFKIIKAKGFLLAIMLSVFSNAAYAATTVYTDAEAFMASSISNHKEIDYSSQYTQTNGSYTQDGVTFSATGGTVLQVTNGLFIPVYNFGNTDFVSWYNGSSGTVSGNYSALGFNFGSYSRSGDVTFSGNGFSRTMQLPARPGTSFFGVISDKSIGTISFSAPALQIIRVSIGNNIAPSVPEPATWLMMLLGFGGIGYSMRSKKKLTSRLQFA